MKMEKSCVKLVNSWVFASYTRPDYILKVMAWLKVAKLLKSIIQKHFDQFGSNWDLYLQSAAFTIRSSVNRSTGMTPAQLVIGENLKHPSRQSQTVH